MLTPPIIHNRRQADMEKESIFSLIWIIPLLTLLITGGLMYNDYLNTGIDITLQLNSGEQITAGKTTVKYLGVVVGKVVDVDINKDVPTTIDVTVRLRKRATALAVEGTTFWLVKPIFSLKKISGLETIVKGQHIAVKPPITNRKELAKLKKKTIFPCYERPPTEEHITNGKRIDFTAKSKGNLDVDSGVYYKDIQIGHIADYKLDNSSKLIQFTVVIYSQYEQLLDSPHLLSRIPLSSINMDTNGVTVNIQNMEIFLKGGLELHLFPQQKLDFPQYAQQILYESKQSAEDAFYKFTNSKLITLYSKNPNNIQPGSPVFFKKIKVGEVKSLSLAKDGENVFIKAVIYSKYRKFVKNSSIFWLQGNFDFNIKGKNLSVTSAPITSIIKGGIEFKNPSVKIKKQNRKLRGYKVFNSYSLVNSYIESLRKGLRIILHSPVSRSLSSGDPVYYRQIKVGHVEWAKLALNAQYVLVQIFIQPTYAHIMHKKAKFWNVGVINTQFNLFSVKIKTESIESMINGGVAFAIPTRKRGAKAKNGDTFHLYEKPEKEWLDWSPKL